MKEDAADLAWLSLLRQTAGGRTRRQAAYKPAPSIWSAQNYLPSLTVQSNGWSVLSPQPEFEYQEDTSGQALRALLLYDKYPSRCAGYLSLPPRGLTASYHLLLSKSVAKGCTLTP